MCGTKGINITIVMILQTVQVGFHPPAVPFSKFLLPFFSILWYNPTPFYQCIHLFTKGLFLLQITSKGDIKLTMRG